MSIWGNVIHQNFPWEGCSMKDIKKILTIAGSDPSGGAGIQADIKTITAHKMYAMNISTALTVQNTIGIRDTFAIPPDFIAAQLDAIYDDIRPDAVKIGMVTNDAIARTIAEKLREKNIQNIVLDPVIASTSGCDLITSDTLFAMVDELLPIVDIVTPNLPEAAAITGVAITDEDSMLKAAEVLTERFPCAVLIKGGHLVESADDLLYADGKARWYKQKRIDNRNTHGTGCALSTAIACGLAAGKPLTIAVEDAKAYVTGAIRAGLDIGKGRGPLLHMWEYM